MQISRCLDVKKKLSKIISQECHSFKCHPSRAYFLRASLPFGRCPYRLAIPFVGRVFVKVKIFNALPAMSGRIEQSGRSARSGRMARSDGISEERGRSSRAVCVSGRNISPPPHTHTHSTYALLFDPFSSESVLVCVRLVNYTFCICIPTERNLSCAPHEPVCIVVHISDFAPPRPPPTLPNLC